MHLEFALHHYVSDNGDEFLNDALAALGCADYAAYLRSDRAAVVVDPANLAPVGVRWNDGERVQTRLFG